MSFEKDIKAAGSNWTSDSTSVSGFTKDDVTLSSSFVTSLKKKAAFTSDRHYNPETDIYRGYFNLSTDYFDRIIQSFKPIFCQDTTPFYGKWIKDSQGIQAVWTKDTTKLSNWS